MKNYILIAVFFSILGCENKPRPNITYLNPALKKVIQGVIDQAPRRSDNTTFTVDIYKYNDTIRFEIWDMALDTPSEQFMGYTMFGKHKICFLADSVYTDYFKIDKKIKIPPDIVDEAKNELAAFVEPSVYISVNPTTVNPIGYYRK